MRAMMGSGNRKPAIGIHVMPYTNNRYTSWNIVKPATALKDTISTQGACPCSNSLQAEDTSQISMMPSTTSG